MIRSLDILDKFIIFLGIEYTLVCGLSVGMPVPILNPLGEKIILFVPNLALTHLTTGSKSHMGSVLPTTPKVIAQNQIVHTYTDASSIIATQSIPVSSAINNQQWNKLVRHPQKQIPRVTTPVKVSKLSELLEDYHPHLKFFSC